MAILLRELYKMLIRGLLVTAGTLLVVWVVCLLGNWLDIYNNIVLYAGMVYMIIGIAGYSGSRRGHIRDAYDPVYKNNFKTLEQRTAEFVTSKDSDFYFLLKFFVIGFALAMISLVL